LNDDKGNDDRFVITEAVIILNDDKDNDDKFLLCSCTGAAVVKIAPLGFVFTKGCTLLEEISPLQGFNPSYALTKGCTLR